MIIRIMAPPVPRFPEKHRQPCAVYALETDIGTVLGTIYRRDNGTLRVSQPRFVSLTPETIARILVAYLDCAESL